MHAVLNTCSDGLCTPRECFDLPAVGFGEGWPANGHCASETASCVQTAFEPMQCFAGDPSPEFGGLDCGECALYKWLECSIAHSCGVEASDLLCCVQAHCADDGCPCAMCEDETNSLSSCNRRVRSYCDSLNWGSAISHCF
jgi:hypothetical protein